MADITMDGTGSWWIAGVAWQSGAVLRLGLAAGATLRRRLGQLALE